MFNGNVKSYVKALIQSGHSNKEILDYVMKEYGIKISRQTVWRLKRQV